MPRMTHPDIPGSDVEVSQEAFDGCWQEIGWQLISARVKKPATATKKSKVRQSDG